jgi:carboxylesterase type B
MQHLLLTAATVASFFGSAIAAPTKFANVETSSGTVVGHPASNKTHVTEFLGIRYAQAPIGELRFAAPKKYEAQPGSIFEASEWVSVQNVIF